MKASEREENSYRNSTHTIWSVLEIVLVKLKLHEI